MFLALIRRTETMAGVVDGLAPRTPTRPGKAVAAIQTTAATDRQSSLFLLL